MNPLEDWVPGKFPDRRDPPEETVKVLLTRVEAQLAASVAQQQTLEQRLAAAQEQRTALGQKIETLVEQMDGLAAKIAPVLEFHQQIKGAQWATAAGAKTAAFLLMILGALGGLVTFAKMHLWAAPK